MEYSVQNLSKTKVEIAISVTGDEWKEEINKGYAKNKHKYAFKGFRKGKVPFHMAMENFHEDLIYDALNYSASRHFSDIVEKEKFDMIGEPNFDVNVIDDNEMKLTVTISLKPQFTLGQYKGLDIKKFDTEVKEEEVNELIEKERNSRGRLVSVERAVQNGDKVNIDFSGSVDGVKFDGGTAEKQDLVIGSNTFIPGFEEQLIGMKIGDTKDIPVKFPADYGEEKLAGKDAIFAIVLHGIQENQLPDFDDEFVKDIDENLNTVEEWKQKAIADLTERKLRQADADFFNQVIDKLLENTEIEIPDCMVDDYIQGNIEDMEQRLKQAYNISFEQYCQFSGMTVDEFKAKQRDNSIKSLKGELIIGELVKDTKIEPSEEDFKAEVAKIPEGQMSQEAFNGIMNKLMMEKLVAFLKENNNLV